MRIAYFTEVLSPPIVDGVALTLARLFSMLESQRLEFAVYAPFPAPPTSAWGRRVRQLHSVRFPLYAGYRVSLPSLTGGKLASSLEALRPELIHVVSPTPTALWAQRYAQRHGIPVVASFHTDFASYLRYHHAGALEGCVWAYLRWFYSRCARAYAPTPATVRLLRERGIENTALWSRGIDTEAFSPAHRSESLRRQLGVSDTTPLLLMASRLVREKDLADLVAADRILRARGVSLRLAIVGDGGMRRELERDLPHATFAGALHGEQLASWYASADVFVLPSTTETLGNVVLEAQASGLPAVVVDRGGPQDLVAQGVSGFVARANNPADLADRLELLLRSPELRRQFGAAARHATLDRGWQRINQALVDDYREVIRLHRSGAARRSAAGSVVTVRMLGDTRGACSMSFVRAEHGRACPAEAAELSRSTTENGRVPS